MILNVARVAGNHSGHLRNLREGWFHFYLSMSTYSYSLTKYRSLGHEKINGNRCKAFHPCYYYSPVNDGETLVSTRDRTTVSAA